MHKKILSLFLISVLTASILPQAAAQESIKQFHVSPGGSYSAKGTLDSPLDGLESARAAVAKYRLKDPDTTIEVIFHEGTYRFDKCVKFASSDSGTEEHPITYKAAEGETVYFKGSKEVDASKIKTVDDPKILAKLPADARGKVGYINLADQGFKDLGSIPITFSMNRSDSRLEGAEFFLNNNQQNIARWPNGRDEYDQFASVVSMGGKGAGGEVGGIFTTKDFRLMKWKDAKDAWMVGFPANDWLYERIKIKSVDVATKQVTLANSAVYGLSMGYSHRYAIVNLLEELDMPGEWYIDHDTNILYYYPERTLKGATFEITTLADNMIYMENVSNVNFQGIIFSQTRSNAFWFRDKMENMTISDCRFENMGRYGIYQQNSTNSKVGVGTETAHQFQENGNENFHLKNNTFYNCGVSAFQLVFGSRDANIPSGSTITNNYVYDNNRVDRRSSGMGFTGVGVEVAYNTIHSTGYGIQYNGADINIHHNEIYNIMNNIQDGSAIYCGRNFINRGNKIHHNYVHDVKSKNPMLKSTLAPAVYLDDKDCGTEIYENIFVGADDGVLINCGMSNKVHDNIVIDATYSVARISTYNLETVVSRQRMETQGKTALKFEGYARFPDIKEDLDSGLVGYPARNTIVNNISSGSKNTGYSDLVMGYNTIEDNYEIEKSEFVDAENGDYRLKRDSQYAKLTSALTEDFDMSTIGVQMSEFKKDPIFADGFKLTYPQNGTRGIAVKDITFDWQRPMGGDRFRLVVAKDSGLKDIVYDISTYETTYTLSGFENGRTYYWKVYAYNESLMEYEPIASLGVPYMFTIAKRYKTDTTDLQALVISANAKLEKMKEGDKIGEYKPGTKEALREKVEQAEKMVQLGGYSEEDESRQIADIDDLLNNDNYINGGYINLGDFLSDKDNWLTKKPELVEIDEENQTLKITTEGGKPTVIGYTGIEDYSRVLALSFKIKLNFDKNPKGWVGMGLRGNSPIDYIYTSGNDQYYMIMKTGQLEYQRNSGGNGVILETVQDENIKPNEWMDVDFGVVNLGNVGQLTILKINGRVAYQAVDSSDDMVLKKGCFQLMASTGTEIEVAASDKELGSFDELVREYTLKMTKDLCTDLEGYNSEKGAFIRSGSTKAYYNGDLHDADAAAGEGTEMKISEKLACEVFGGNISGESIVIGTNSYTLPEHADGMINLKVLAQSVGKDIYFHNDQKLAFIADKIDMHTANYGRKFNTTSNAMALYK